MHILIIHQAFASLDEPGGTRHHEFARLLSAHGHQVTVIAVAGELYYWNNPHLNPSPSGRWEKG